MSDLESRLAGALARGADGAPTASGLAAAARTRSRARRRNRVAAAAAAAALVVGVPTAVLASRGSDPDSQPAHPPVAKDPAAPGQVLPGGFHFESWHEASVAVPDEWGYGSLSDWCANSGDLDTPRVERPGTVHLEILCSPASSYGLSFAPAQADGGKVDWPVAEQHSDSWPDGAFVGATTVGDVVVTVAAPDVTVALDVLASAKQNQALDPNGCPVDGGLDPVIPAGTMAVCRYDESGQLEQSELLRGTEPGSAEAALVSAPDTTPAHCDATPGQVIRMASLSDDAEIDLGCGTLTVHGVPRILTSVVLYWALSPGWSGGVGGDTPLPPELRQR